MKRIFPCLIAIIIAAGCAKHDAMSPAVEANAESPWKVSHNTNDEPVITLDEATQTHMGLKLAMAGARQLEVERKAYGRVVDPVLLSSAIADFEAARTMADASQ